MKALSIRQPWASLICRGTKDVENRTWKTKYRGKLLIHASSYKCPKDFANRLPLEMGNILYNDNTYGSLDFNDFPSSAIIGYVDLVDCVEGEYDSIWAEDDCVKFVFENAYMFDEPITGVKGKLNIFDYDMDENNLPPAHKVELALPYINEDELVIPVADNIFEEFNKIEGPKTIELFWDDDTTELFLEEKCDENGLWHVKKLENIKKVTLVTKDDTKKTYKFLRTDSYPLTDENNEPITLPSITTYEDAELWVVAISFE